MSYNCGCHASVLRSKSLQSLLGKLSFVTACVHASRIFLLRLLNALRSFPSHAKHRSVTLTMRQDILWWNTFLPLFNGVSVIKPAEWLFVNLRLISTDACKVWGGATCLDKCITVPFPDFVLSAATHISALELFTIVVAVKFWASILQHQRFIILCDNEAAVTVINSGSTRDPFMQGCLRELWFLSTLYDFDIRVQHIPGEHNSLLDALSHWDDPPYQIQFAKTPQDLGISYVFDQIPGDFFVFDVD